jgi:hypothetical protein
MNSLTRIAFTSLLLVGAACSGKESKSAAPVSTAAQQAAFATFAVDARPSDAQPVLAVRANAKPGDQVVISGRVKDFVDGRAAFTLIDPSLPSCDEEGPMKTCDTPWDFCCTDIKVINQASATVELRDASGVLKTGLAGYRGFDHLTPTVVVGKLESDNAGNLLVAANQIWIGERKKN